MGQTVFTIRARGHGSAPTTAPQVRARPPVGRADRAQGTASPPTLAWLPADSKGTAGSSALAMPPPPGKARQVCVAPFSFVSGTHHQPAVQQLQADGSARPCGWGFPTVESASPSRSVQRAAAALIIRQMKVKSLLVFMFTTFCKF